jgi:hypothetical protein
MTGGSCRSRGAGGETGIDWARGIGPVADTLDADPRKYAPRPTPAATISPTAITRKRRAASERSMVVSLLVRLLGSW